MGLEIEQADPLKACTVSFKFICFKTPWGGIERVPKKFFFNFKFFTFPQVKTAVVSIKNELQEGLKAGQPYYLSRVIPSQQSGGDTMHDPNLLSVAFNVDPSISKIENENERLALYLYERFLTIDIFDADSLFLYGTCKLPLFELLRQGRGSVVRAKECEMCDPETGEARGSVQLIMTNVGQSPSVVIVNPADAASNDLAAKKRT